MDENKLGGSIMAEESTRDKTIGSILGDTSLQLMEDAVERDTEFQDSLLGKALFYGPSMIMGARIGGSIDKTLGITQYFKDKKEAKNIYEENKIMPSGKRIQEEYGSFKDFFRTEIRDRARSNVMKLDQGEKIKTGIDDEYDGTLIDQLNVAGEIDQNPDLGSRSGRKLGIRDKQKVRAFYLNSLNDYQYNPITDTTEQLTPRMQLFQGNAPAFGGSGPIQLGTEALNMMPQQPASATKMNPVATSLGDASTYMGSKGYNRAQNILDVLSGSFQFLGSTFPGDLRQLGVLQQSNLFGFKKSEPVNKGMSGYGFDTPVDPNS